MKSKRNIVIIILFLTTVVVAPVCKASASASADPSSAYQFYIQKAQNAVSSRQNDKARHYLELAEIYASNDVEILNVHVMRSKLEPSPDTLQPTPQIQKPLINEPVSNAPAVVPRSLSASVPTAPLDRAVYGQNSTPDVIALDDIVTPGSSRNILRLVLNKNVILEGKDIQRFLVMDEGYIEVKILSKTQIMIFAHRVGTTFLHIWDDSDRKTLHVEIVLPALQNNFKNDQSGKIVKHADKFKFTYSNDWSAYYNGWDIGKIRRQSLNVQQYFGIDGPTPFGILDASTNAGFLNNAKDFTNYTVGLSHVPTDIAKDLNVRVYNARRNLSPMTMPSSYLKGVFTDMVFAENLFGLSFSHGSTQPVFGFFTGNDTKPPHSYINAYKVVLFPQDPKNQYAINYAQSYGRDRPQDAAKHAMSVETKQTMDHFNLRTELGRDGNEKIAGTAGLRYENQGFISVLSFRDIDPQYNTIIGAGPGQGDIGTTWTTSEHFANFSTETYIDIFRNRTYFNLQNPDNFNFDMNAHAHVDIAGDLSNDTGVTFITTPSDFSPRHNFGVNNRISKVFDIWNSKKATAYLGNSFDTSRYKFSGTSDFNKFTTILGAQVPLTKELSTSASYEYSMLYEPFSDRYFYPNVFNSGLNYRRSFNDKLSGTMYINYRQEAGKGGTNSFLSGEDSIQSAVNLTYNPSNDLSYFLDTSLRRIWPRDKSNALIYNLDLRLGMRLLWGSPIHWDPNGTIAGYVYKDKGGDGKRNADEEGIPNINVKVGDQIAVTDQNGYYQTDIRAKEVTVTPESKTIPSGYVYSTPTSVDKPIQQWKKTMVDFGLTTQSSVYGIVFVDKNGNGLPDAGDQYVWNVKMILDGKVTEVTDPRGSYYFKNIEKGKHTIALAINSLPIDMMPILKIKGEITVMEGTTYTYHVPLKIKAQP